MLVEGVSLNGIDPEGDDPPDEILYRDGETYVDLTYQGRNDVDDWRLVTGPKGESKPVGDDFARAFAKFAREVRRASDDGDGGVEA